jgi:hypothetical protein
MDITASRALTLPATWQRRRSFPTATGLNIPFGERNELRRDYLIQHGAKELSVEQFKHSPAVVSVAVKRNGPFK